MACGASYMEFLFCDFKVFRLHTKLHNAARAVPVHSHKGPGYCFMIVRRRNSCALGHLSGRFFCLYVKVFLPSIFKFIDFWCSTPCFVLDIEPVDENVFLKLGVRLMRRFRDTHFVLQEKQTHKANILVYKNVARNFVKQ